MRTYAGLIPRYLRHQKKRALLTAAGIALSVALLVFISMFVVNLKEMNFKTAERLYGSYHVRFIGLEERQSGLLRHHPDIRTSGELLTASVQAAGPGRTVSLFGVDSPDTLALLPVVFLQGRAPERPDEAVLAEWAVSALGLASELDQTIEAGGRTFRLVGIISNPRHSWIGDKAARMAGMVIPGTLEQIGKAGSVERNLFVRFQDRLIPEAEDVYTQTSLLRDKAGISKSALNHNDEWIEAYGTYKRKDIASMAVVAVDVAATVIAIYNMFHISVLEKMRQYGILRAIGMNARQLRRLVIGEALLLGGLSIPIGILLGSGAMHAAVSFVFTGPDVPALIMPWTIPVTAAALGLCTVMLAALHPAVTVGRISPLDALREASAGSRLSVTAHPKRSRMRFKLFGLSGSLAARNLSRSRSRFAVTVLSMSLATVLFIGVHYFVGIQNPAASIRHQFLWGSDYYLSAGSNREGRGFDEADLRAVRATEGVRDVYPTQYSYGYTYLRPEQVSENFGTMLETEQEELANPLPQSGVYTSLVKTYFYPDDLIVKAEDYLIAGKIDRQALAEGKDILIIQSGDEPKLLLKPGDMLELGHTQLVDGPKNDNWSYYPNTRQVRIGGILKRFPQVGNPPDIIQAVSHSRYYETFSGSKLYRKIDFRLDGNANRTDVEESLKAIAKSKNGQLVSFRLKEEAIRKEFEQMNRLLYAFITIIALIGALSIMNTMTTNLLLRTKEFGVMRAIGMSELQLRGMVRMEGILYALHSGLWGAVLGVGSTFAVHGIVSKELPDMVPAWQFPWLSVLLALAGTSAIIMLSTVLPLRRLRRLAIVDSIRHVE